MNSFYIEIEFEEGVSVLTPEGLSEELMAIKSEFFLDQVSFSDFEATIKKTKSHMKANNIKFNQAYVFTACALKAFQQVAQIYFEIDSVKNVYAKQTTYDEGHYVMYGEG